MLPTIGSGAFSEQQVIDWRVDWYNSSMSTPEQGIGFRIFNPTTSFTTTGMQTAANPVSYINTNTTPVLTNSGTWGLTPLVLNYWGTGAPPGVTTARYVAMHWRGFVGSNTSWAFPQGTTGSVWLSFSGMGFVRVQRNGVDILNSKLNYSTFVSSSLFTPSPGDQIDIFYWQNGDQWGGVVGSWVAQQNGQSSATTAITTPQYRESPPIAASLIPYSTATAFTLPQVMNATVEVGGPMETPTLRFSIPLINANASIGYRISNSPRKLTYTDINGLTTTFKRRQLVKFFGGFAGEQYQRFTGHILDFNEQDGVVTVVCSGLEERMAKTNVQNYPDPISYDTFGYFKTLSTSEPIYGITAYDNWPIEHAIKDLAYRAGIDPKLFAVQKTTNTYTGGVISVTDLIGNPVYYFRGRRINGDYIKLQRPALYGNSAAGFDPSKPPDDQYIYKGNLSRSLLDWSRELADALGYDFRSNALGAMVLTVRNNPQRYLKITGGTTAYSAGAIQGSYQQFASSFSGTITMTINAARIDLVSVLGSTLGSFNYTVNIMSGSQVAAGTINLNNPTSVFFYDQILTPAGANIAATTLWSGDWGAYTIKLTNNANNINLDSLLLYDMDSSNNILPIQLQTDLAIETISTATNAQEAINYALVIGKRKAVITDSEKDINPNNPQYEYWVSASADPSSIWDPNATNYVGGVVATTIVDDKISDQDYANWASQTLIIRQRDPGPSATFTHPIIPFLEPRDPIAVLDANYVSITGSNLVWVQSITEEYAYNTATSSVTTTAYPQIASYEPRLDLDVATIDSVFFGQPVINFNISYPSIDSGTVVNPGANMTNPQVWGYSRNTYLINSGMLASYGSDAQGTYILMSGVAAWPPVPDSIAIGPDHPEYVGTPSAQYRGFEYGTFKNNPYMKFTHIYDYNSKKIYLPSQAADGPVTGTTQYNLGGWNLANVAHIFWMAPDATLTPTTVYSGVCPFYDPYMSELPDGNLINITMDMLTTGYYRVSVWDARNKNNPIQVAWLTSPENDPTDPNTHWQYITAGRAFQFLWDGVDNIGQWNASQSSDYADIARGWFEKDQRPEIGKGFYAWNDKNTQIVHISGQLLGGKLVFNPGNYSQFYVKVECMNDAFAQAYEAGTNLAQSIRTTNSNNLQGASVGQNPKSQEFIYMHLPPPTTLNITAIEDWNPLVKAYDPNNDPYSLTTGWTILNSGIGDTYSTFRNDKPIRITFTANARPGGRFSGNHNFTTMKVHRSVHLNATFLDLLTLFEGQPWHSLTPIEKKRIIARHLTNTTNTVEFEDTDWRTGDTLDQPQNKWVLRPKDFQVTVDGITQPLTYCDYLQLEDIPGYTQNRTQGQARSRLLLAYISYLFYMSTYIQDRSGRMTWALDTSDIDYSKICFHTFPSGHPEDLENYSKRTIIARQWVDPNYVNTLSQQWLFSGTASTYTQFIHNRLTWNDSDATKVLTIDTTGGTVTGALANVNSDPYALEAKNVGYLHSDYNTNRTLGALGSLNFFGSWTWEGSSTGGSEDILWIPDLTRDFHPYGLIPPMTLQSQDGYIFDQNLMLKHNIWGITSMDNSQWFKFIDQALNDNWFGVTYPITNANFNNNSHGFRNLRPGHTAEEHIALSTNVNTPVDPDIFNYQRQIEQPHWEDFRGIISTGKFPSNNQIQVVPSAGAYLMNLYKYRDITRYPRIQFTGGGAVPTPISASVEPMYFFLMATKDGTVTAETDTAEGWFQWTFRGKYQWYSPSYFPVNEYGFLLPRYLYKKWSVIDWGTPYNYDAGAWVGWKDDHDPTFINGLSWEDHATIDISHAPLNGTAGIGAFNFFNIFLVHNLYQRFGEIYRMPIAIGPRLATSKDVFITLALVNSRRSTPVAAQGQ